MAENKVVIVGAGNAGLAAAHELDKAGIDFVVLEASDRYGGRVKYDQYQDIIYNDGAAFTEPQWETTFSYIQEFGLEPLVFEFNVKTYGLWNNGEVTYFVDRGNLFDSLLQVKGLPKSLIFQGARFLPSFLKAMNLVGDEHDFSKLTEISNQSVREWCIDHGGEEVANRLLGPMLGMMTLARTCDVCAAHPIALMKLMKGMSGIAGGLKLINDNLYETMKDKVRLSTPVDEILIENDEIKGVRLANGEIIETDKVICCTDSVDALKLMPNIPQVMRDDLDTCTYCKTWHYVFYIEEQMVPQGFMSLFIPESEDSIITTIFGGPLTEADKVPDVEPIHKFDGSAQTIHTFTAGWHDDYYMGLSEEERHEAVKKEIAKFYPGFDEKAEVIASNRMERAINLEPPGQFEAIQDLKNNHLSDVKGLYLGGEYMFLIACTEGAWMTGKEAADKLIAEQ